MKHFIITLVMALVTLCGCTNKEYVAELRQELVEVELEIIDEEVFSESITAVQNKCSILVAHTLEDKFIQSQKRLNELKDRREELRLEIIKNKGNVDVEQEVLEASLNHKNKYETLLNF